jgi:hypothetical protein
MQSRLREAKHARLERIEFCAPLHLALDQLQLADLPPVWPLDHEVETAACLERQQGNGAIP